MKSVLNPSFKPKWSGHFSGLTTIIALLAGYTTIAQVNIVPMPAELKMGKGNFNIDKTTEIVLEGSNLEKCAGFINAYLKKTVGFTLPVSKKTSGHNRIILNYERMDEAIAGAYIMNVAEKEIYIAGDNEAGVFYAVQTLLQLMPVKTELPLSIPQLSITDRPRFAYRGMHLDVCRHFFTVEQVKKYLDYMSAYKLNTFHWHLTEDQGWRIEIKKYPRLTSVGGYRNGTIIGSYPGTGNDSIVYGGFYTQQQIKEIVKYAAERFIEIIPEIEMPGHSSAAIAAYPQLSCFPGESTAVPINTAWAGSRQGKQVQQSWGVFEDVFSPSEYTFKFLQDVIDEVVQLFPSKYIHIGGDECPKESWKRSAFCQQLIKEKKLKDEHELQSYFIKRMEKYINSKGKKIIGWDEILEGGLAPNATVMSWRGEAGGIAAAKQNHDVIMTPEDPLYINHAQSRNEDSVTQGGYNPLEAVYKYEPVPKELTAEQGKHILGAQGNMWAEYLKSQSKLEYMLFPRMIALSEVLWTPKEKRSWGSFEKRLPAIFERLDAQKINHSNAYYDLKATVLPTDNNQGVLWKIESNNKNGKIVWVSSLLSSQVHDYSEPVLIKETMEGMQASYVVADKTVSAVSQTFHFNKATGKKITLINQPSKNYPGDGAFTLLNGVQNVKGLQRSSEFLGFAGTDLEAIIDLGSITEFTSATVYSFTEKGSWIYPPGSVSFQFSLDGIDYSAAVKADADQASPERRSILQAPDLTSYKAKYIKVLVKNYGIIPSGQPGSGNGAWLFVDEIEVK